MKHSLSWKRALRRIAALFFATVALWLLNLTCDFGAACVRLGESSAFVAAALRAELGAEPWDDSPLSQMNSWQRLAVSQSVFLRTAGKVSPFPQDTSSVSDTAPPNNTFPTSEDSSETPLPETTTAPEDIQERTLLPADTEGYLSTQGVYLFNYTNQTMDMQTLSSAQVNVDLSKEGPQILIMHTHGSEAYTMDGEDIYEESDSSRTTDENYNVVRIGEEMKHIFEEKGLTVIHDCTLYDYPQYSGAYGRSCEGAEAWLKQYPSIQIVLDIHRDALIGEDGTVYKAVTEINGTKTAQVLMIVGTDESAKHPYWTDNLALAIRIQQELDARWPTLARPITLRSSRFNQQLTHGSLLIEVGSHGNTLQEALHGARLFADAAGDVLVELTQGQ